MASLPLASLLDRQVPATPWAEGDNLPWDDPAFSQRMLAEHLSQQHDRASRRAATIDAQVRFLARQVAGGDGARVLDLVGRAVADAAGAARAELLRNLISGEQRPQDPRTSSEPIKNYDDLRILNCHPTSRSG